MSMPSYTTAKAAVNVTTPVYCPLTETSGTWTYGTVAAIAPAMTVKADTPVNTKELYGDGTLQEVASDYGKTTLELEVNALPDTVRAALFGHTYDSTTKKLTFASTDVKPYVAIGFAVELADASWVGYWFLKGKISEGSMNVQQRETSTEFSTVSLTGEFIDYTSGKRWIKLAGTKAEVETFLSAAPSV